MEFTKAMEVMKRMCLNLECIVCPLWEKNNDRRVPCLIFMEKYPTEAEQLLIEWDKAHPVKTFLSDFKEKYPNAPLGNDKTPNVCVCTLGYTKNKKALDDCDEFFSNCYDCWNRPLEVQK